MITKGCYRLAKAHFESDMLTQKSTPESGYVSSHPKVFETIKDIKTQISAQNSWKGLVSCNVQLINKIILYKEKRKKVNL